MRLTVLLPVYNSERYLGSAIQSILDQDFADFEFLIIDDKSSDRSGEIIEAHARRDKRIRAIIHERNLGLAATLNEGLREAAGDLVARMDHDDEALPSRLRVQRDFMMSRPEIAAAGSFVYHMGPTPAKDRLVTLPTAPDAIRAALPKDNCFYHPSMILRRREILQAGGYRAEFKNAEDYDLWLRLSERHDLANIPTPLLRYRFTTSGMTLSRKWEQYLYHHLARAAHANRGLPFGEVMAIAARERASRDRSQFLLKVYRGTIAEHAALGNWREAAELLSRTFRELGVSAGVSALRSSATAALEATPNPRAE